jgi:hypothetical protein
VPDPAMISGVVATTCATTPSIWWVQPLVTGAAALGGGIIAGITILTHRQIARVRATLDLIERTESQPYYQELWAAFREAREESSGFDYLLAPKNDTFKHQRAKVLAFLNHYELVAVGCKNGVLDENFYKNFMRHSFVRDFVKAEKFIKALRSPPREPPLPRAYEHFEALAREWLAEEKAEEAAREPTA